MGNTGVYVGNWQDATPRVGHESAVIWSILLSSSAGSEPDNCLQQIGGMHRYAMQGRKNSDYHAHAASEQYYYILGGHGEVLIDGEKYPVSEGSVAYFAPGSKHTVGENVFGRMRPHARLIVVSRGGVVEEGALLKALQSGRIAGAALDVFESEPLAEDSPFWDLPNVLITPHVSAETAETFTRRRDIFRSNLQRYFAGEPLLYEVDKHAGY